MTATREPSHISAMIWQRDAALDGKSYSAAAHHSARLIAAWSEEHAKHRMAEDAVAARHAKASINYWTRIHAADAKRAERNAA